MAVTLKGCAMLEKPWAFTNKMYVHPENKRKIGTYAMVSKYVFTLADSELVGIDQLAHNVTQRTQCEISLTPGVEGNLVKLVPFAKPERNYLMQTGDLIITSFTKQPESNIINFEYKTLVDAILTTYNEQFFLQGQQFVLERASVLFILQFTSFNILDESQLQNFPAQGSQFGMVKLGETTLTIKSPQKNIKINNAPISMEARSSLFSKDLDLQRIGVGGLNEQFNVIFRRAFASRLLPPALVTRLKLSHVKGILLYGPPGTGKTLIAREIAQLLECKDIQKIAGPAILDKYIGEAERKIRELFAPAEKEQAEKGDESELHVIIFDEIDALFKQRGSTRDSTGVLDGVVNQLLSKMDGTEPLNNILIIGMTNRKDLLDDAILRPGRFEVHIEINLPNKEGRIEILNIHTKQFREEKILDPSVSIDRVAEKAKNYTGAELRAVVNSAFSRAQTRIIDMNNLKKNIDYAKMIMTETDFDEALVENKPKFGCTEMPSPRVIDIKENWFQRISELFKVMTETRGLSTLLLYGKSGTGKTSLACHMAQLSKFSYAKLVSADQMVALQESTKCSDIKKSFDDGYRTEEAIIVLDEIESLIEYIGVGPRFSANITQVIKVLLKKPPGPKCKLIIIGTTSQYRVLEELGIAACFNHCKKVEEIHVKDSANIISELGFKFKPSTEECLAKLPPTMPIKEFETLLQHASIISRSSGGEAGSVVTADALQKWMTSQYSPRDDSFAD